MHLAGGRVEFAPREEDGPVRVDKRPHDGVADAVPALLLHRPHGHASELVGGGDLDRRPPVLVLAVWTRTHRGISYIWGNTARARVYIHRQVVKKKEPGEARSVRARSVRIGVSGPRTPPVYPGAPTSTVTAGAR